jgi:hypothetical protein
MTLRNGTALLEHGHDAPPLAVRLLRRALQD